MRNNRDVKFVIYQVLYIFVVCVIALKGANIDLAEVISKEKVVEKTYADSIKSYLDSILSLGLVPEIKIDTTRKIENIEELRRQLDIMKQQLVVVQTNPTFIPPEIRREKPEEEKKPEEKEELSEDITPLRVQTLTQYTTNTITNRGNQTLEIVGDGGVIVSIPSGGTRTFTLGGESSVTYRMGNQTKTVNTKDNQKPKISMQRLVPAGEEVSLRTIQSSVGYRISISDDYPGQLEVKFTGPVTVKQSGESTYDVTLNFLGSKGAYDNFTENRDSPYTVSFQITVKDKVAPHSLTQTGVFQFGEW